VALHAVTWLKCELKLFRLAESVLNLANGIHWQTDHFKYEHIYNSQLSQSLLGAVVNLLLLKCVSLLRLNKAVAAAVSTWNLIFSNLLWLLVAY